MYLRTFRISLWLFGVSRKKKLFKNARLKITRTQIVTNYPDLGVNWFSLKTIKIARDIINNPVLNYTYPTEVSSSAKLLLSYTWIRENHFLHFYYFKR